MTVATIDPRSPTWTPAEPKRLCECGKQCLTRAEARKAARNLNSHQQNERWPVHAYQCGSWWHAGHVQRIKRTGGRTGPSGLKPKPLTPRDQLPPELR